MILPAAPGAPWTHPDERPWLVIVDDKCDRDLLRRAATAFAANGSNDVRDHATRVGVVHKATICSRPTGIATIEFSTFNAPIDSAAFKRGADRMLLAAADSVVTDLEINAWEDLAKAIALRAAITDDPHPNPTTMDRFASLTWASPWSPHVAQRQNGHDPANGDPIPAITATHEQVDFWAGRPPPIVLVRRIEYLATQNMKIVTDTLTGVANNYHSTDAIARLRLQARFA